MPRRPGLFAFLIILCSGLTVVVAPNADAQHPSALLLSSMPLVFEPNQGQAPAAYQFLARRNSSTTFFLADGVDVFVPRSAPDVSRVGIRWVGANVADSVSGEELLPGRSNYFRGSDSSRWVRNVPQFARVRYKQLYPGIDLVFHGSGDALEHNFILQPGAKPDLIRLLIDRPFRIDRSGDLVTKIGNTEIRLVRPVAYQKLGESRKEVAARFALARNGDVRFRLGPYDRTEPLVIDPVFVFSTYLDGSGSDEITAVTTDATGNIYVTGFTGSTDFPSRMPIARSALCVRTSVRGMKRSYPSSTRLATISCTQPFSVVPTER